MPPSLNSISLRLRLVVGFFIAAILVALLAYFSVITIRSTHQSFDDIVGNHIPRLDALQNMRVVAVDVNKASSMLVLQTKPADIDATKQALRGNLELLAAKERDYITLIQAGDEDERADIANDFKTVTAARLRVDAAAKELIALREKNVPIATLIAKEAELGLSEDSLGQALKTTIDQDFSAITNENAEIDSKVARAIQGILLYSVLAAVVALGIGGIIAVTFSRSIKKLREGSARLTGGDFSSQIALYTKDELGQLAGAFNQMSSSLRASYLRLALEKERDETLLESMSEGMVALDDKGNIVLINGVALELFELGSQEEVTGKRLADVVTLFTQDGHPLTTQTHPLAALHGGNGVNDVFGYLTKDKRKILVNVAASPVKLEEKTAGAIFVLRDVTKEREVDRMKTEFISLASHQLRTPLSAIKWFSEMLLNGDAGKLGPEQLDFTKNIADSTDRMVDLVNSLLNISRIESGRIIVDPRPTDLKELITGIVNDLKAKIEERQQNLVISVHDDLPKINLDPRLISQVYLNLLTNAIKYTQKKGEIAVFISRKGDDIISQVTDNGYGIPKEQQARIFQKFFRAENVAKVETDGTGLGLYLIKAIVESSGGKIWFESEEGKGTSFWFTIPVSGMIAKEGEVTLDA